EISTVIFDEIDTGVSGRVAQSIAEKMYQISKSTQVLGITHLSQVAAMCDNHLVIQKAERNNRTVTTIKQLDNDDKIHELAKMITGNELTNAALEHAEQLLEMTDTYKAAASSQSSYLTNSTNGRLFLCMHGNVLHDFYSFSRLKSWGLGQIKDTLKNA